MQLRKGTAIFMNEEIKYMLNKPLMEKLDDMRFGIQGNIKAIFDQEPNSNRLHLSHENGQIYAFSLCLGMLDAIMRLEDRRKKEND